MEESQLPLLRVCWESLQSILQCVLSDKETKWGGVTNHRLYKLRDMKIKGFYLCEYPTDELGVELNDNATFTGLLNELFTNGNVYEYIGVGDSLIRERLFERLAEELETSYDYVYNLWLN